MKYLALVFFLLVLAWNFIYFWNGRKRKKKEKELADRTPPVFKVNKNYFPVYGDYAIHISDFIEDEKGVLMQLHCRVMQGDELVRGFCSADLFPFERKVRASMRGILDAMRDNRRDETKAIKIWYSNADGSPFSDTADIPLRITVTFYKPVNIDDSTRNSLKQCIYPYLQELMEIDLNEVNTVLKNCCAKEERLVNTLARIKKLDAAEIGISDSAINVCRHISMDMDFFYENQWFYGSGMSGYDTIYTNLKTKYRRIEDCYLERLSNEYLKDTIF